MKRLVIAAVGLIIVAMPAAAAACGGGEATPTLSPIPTEVAASPTAARTAAAAPSAAAAGTVPKGWERHRTANFQIDLPETWVFFDPTQQTYEALLEMLRRQAPELVSRAEEYVAPNLDEIALFAFDTESVDILHNLVISFQEQPSPITLPLLINQLEAAWSADPGRRLVSSDSDLTVGGLSAGRVVLSMTANRSDVILVEYFVLSEPTAAFILTFASGTSSFERLEPVFEQIAQSFRVLESR